MPPEESAGSSLTQAGAEASSGAPTGSRPSGFPLLFSLVLGVCLLVVLVRDPAEAKALQKEMVQMRLLSDEQISRANKEIRDLQAVVLRLQQDLGEAQEAVQETQHALGEARKVNDQLDAAVRASRPSLPPPAMAPEALVPPSVAAAPETAAERQSRAFKDLEAVVSALRANAAEYVNLTKALAETKRALALAKGAPPADAAGVARSTAGSLAEWPQDDLLSEEELARRDAAVQDAATTVSADASDLAAINRDVSRFNRALAHAQRRLGDGQKQLGALQEELRAALAHPVR